MKKIAFFLIATLLLTSELLADANVDPKDTQKSYLLTAPGTITGAINPQKVVPEAPQHRFAPETKYINPQPYQFVPDHYNFPQYGQLRAHPNPWLDRPAARQPMQLPPEAGQYFDNPWDIKNLPSLEPNGYQNKPVPGESMANPAYGFYGDDYGNSSFYPRFSTPLDHNLLNPSSAAGFPDMNNLMPGLGNDDSGFPFMPFGMF